MKFGISRVTPDDEEPRYLVTIDAPFLHGIEVKHFSFYCSGTDLQMIQRALLMEQLPHPQRAPEGCPAKGCKTCEECVEHAKKLKERE